MCAAEIFREQIAARINSLVKVQIPSTDRADPVAITVCGGLQYNVGPDIVSSISNVISEAYRIRITPFMTMMRL